jgi:hypothetical protein
MLPSDFGSVCDKEGFVVLPATRIFTAKLELLLYDIINDLPFGECFDGSHFQMDLKGATVTDIERFYSLQR